MDNIYRFINRNWPPILEKIRLNKLNLLENERHFSTITYRVPLKDGKTKITPLTFLSTIGCYHFTQGGCTMCNFNIRNRHTGNYSDQIMSAAKEALKYSDIVNQENKNLI
jgi:uncharacterized Fe-S cluster-containing MiaB family protein